MLLVREGSVDGGVTAVRDMNRLDDKQLTGKLLSEKPLDNQIDENISLVRSIDMRRDQFSIGDYDDIDTSNSSSHVSHTRESLLGSEVLEYALVIYTVIVLSGLLADNLHASRAGCRIQYMYCPAVELVRLEGRSRRTEYCSSYTVSTLVTGVHSYVLLLQVFL